jgi:hypothetical protein
MPAVVLVFSRHFQRPSKMPRGAATGRRDNEGR